MQRRAYLKTATAAITASAPLLAGCTSSNDDGSSNNGSSNSGSSNSGNNSGNGGQATTTQAQSGQTVQMATEGGSYYFDPVGLFVEPGTTVTWVIKSGSHTSTAYDNRIPKDAKPWKSGMLTEEGATYKHTFETTGTYDYYCLPHKSLGMIARLVVGEPGGPAEGSMPPDGKVPKSQTIVDQGAVSHSEFSQ